MEKSSKNIAAWRSILFATLMLLAELAAAHSQTAPPDVPSGFLPGAISVIAGGGTGISLPVQATQYLLSETGGGPGPVTVDAQRNVYFAITNAGSQSATIYAVYSGALPVPPLIAAVTTQASPAVPAMAGYLYTVAGFLAPTASGPGGDGGPASQAFFSNLYALFFDAAGNLYVTDYDFGGSTSSNIRVIDHATTNVSTIAGMNSGVSAPTTCTPTDDLGDGCPATSAILAGASQSYLDSAGNLYIADSSDALIRVVYGGVTEPALLAVQGMSQSSLTAGSIYIVAGQYNGYCSATPCGNNVSAIATTLGQPIGVTADGDGNLYIADSYPGTIRIVYAGGVKVPPVLTAQGWTPIANPSTNTSLNAGYIYTVAGNEFIPCAASTVCGDGQPAIESQFTTPVYNALFNFPTLIGVDSTGNIYIVDVYDNTVRKLDATGYISSIAGVETPSGVAFQAGTPGDNPPPGTPLVPATSVYFNGPNGIAFDAQDNLYVADSANYLIWEAAPLQSQTIAFAALSPVTYGVAPITLEATASSGLPVSFSIAAGSPATLSGNTLSVTGAGTIQIAASQAGNVAYAAAAAVPQTLTVDAATLTVTADNKSKGAGQANPPLTATISGLVNGDKQASVYTGQPALTTTATTSSAAGTYPIAVAQGGLTLLTKSYGFTYVDGTLIVSGGTTPQTISFPPLGTVTYGQATTVALLATASSGLPITYTLTGTGAKLASNGASLTITGAGMVTVTASQAGNDTYLPATSVSQTLTVLPAPLTVTGPIFSLLVGSTIEPSTFPAPTIAGLVAPDTLSVVTGSPLYTTTATATSPAGVYPVPVAPGTLGLSPGVAANYVFANFVPGALTLNLKQQSISFIQIVNQVYGNVVMLQATASSGLPVTFTVTGVPVSVDSFTTQPALGIVSFQLGLEGVGTLTATATQAGNGFYAPAPPTVQTISVGQAPLDFYATPVSREFGAPNPTFTYQFNNTPGAPGSLVNGDTDIPSVVSGVPNLNTTATQTSSSGTYPIVMTQGTLVAPNYYFVFNNSTLTIGPPGSYSIAFTPPSLTIPAGQSRQTTITLTSTNFYQGTVTVGCGALPANVSCVVSPSSFTFTGANVNESTSGLQGTLTINTYGGGTVVGASRGRNASPLLASFFLLPGLGLALLLMLGRRRTARYSNLWRVGALFLVAAGALGIDACGGSSTSALYATPGTTAVTVSGTGTSVTGTGSVPASATLNVTIQ